MSHQHGDAPRIGAREHPLTRRAFLRRAALAAGLTALVTPSAAEAMPSPQAAIVPSLTPHNPANLTVSNVKHISASNVIKTGATSAGLGTTTFYVSPSGNDANNGASWATAKKTILAAYDALPSPSGGTIYIADGSFVGGSVINQGIWIVGADDPSFANPLSGWRQQKVVRFIGVGSDSLGLQFGVGTAPSVNGGQPPNGIWEYNNSAKPCIWLAGTGNSGIVFENLSFAYPAVGIRLGINAAQTNRNTNTALALFRNIHIALFANGVVGNQKGPVVDVGYAFWLVFDNCVFLGYPGGVGDAIALTDDRHAVMLMKADPRGSSPGLMTIRNNRWAQGGIKYIAGATSAGTILVDDLLVESNGILSLPPVFWLTNNSSNVAQITLRMLSQADAGASSLPVVQVDGGGPSDSVLVTGVSGPLQGPMTVLGADPATFQGFTVTPLRQGQAGIVSGRLTGQHDSARRSFAPTIVRFQNHARQDWSSYIPAGATVTTGQVAPDGSTGAVRLQMRSGVGGIQPWRPSLTLSVGDVFVIGSWVRGFSTPGLGANSGIAFGINGSRFTYKSITGGATITSPSTYVLAAPFAGDGGEWVWLSAAIKITALGTNPADVIALQLQTDSRHPAIFYAPMAVYVPTGTISDNEAAELVTHLSSWSDAATVGQVSTLKSHIFNALGGLTVGGGKLTIPVVTADPGGLANGMIWYNSTSGTFKCYQNGAVKTFTVR